MALRMVALNTLSNGQFFSRKVIPVDVRDAYSRLYGGHWEAQLRQPADIPRAEAKARHAEWIAEIETRIPDNGLKIVMRGADKEDRAAA
jgi:hypothetical protein